MSGSEIILDLSVSILGTNEGPRRLFVDATGATRSGPDFCASDSEETCVPAKVDVSLRLYVDLCTQNIHFFLLESLQFLEWVDRNFPFPTPGSNPDGSRYGLGTKTVSV